MKILSTVAVSRWLGSLMAGALFGAVFHLTDGWAIAIKLLCIAAAFIAVRGTGSKWHACLAGWAWGAGATLTGMGWLYIAMHDIGGLPAWMAGIAMVLFSLLLGAFNGAAALGAAWLKTYSRLRPALCGVLGAGRMVAHLGADGAAVDERGLWVYRHAAHGRGE
jgi:apolipoprotein N-acyltransferase